MASLRASVMHLESHKGIVHTFGMCRDAEIEMGDIPVFEKGARERYFEENGLMLAATTIQSAWRCRDAREYIGDACTLPFRSMRSVASGCDYQSDVGLAGNMYYEALGAQSARGSDSGVCSQAKSDAIYPTSTKSLPSSRDGPERRTARPNCGQLSQF